ncbi:MAG: hypothetical protein COW84_06545 [Gammaproteobacteria bacterium CG22_combo_CG10-13_8_21_14_all_40_8]|nr:MAG: hypothetical protein COW84_06545 [Gammaproteobacteria bacterium CG22_combo_CG10-13_8_21_14_all_40_8]
MTQTEVKPQTKNNHFTIISLLVIFALPMVIAYSGWWLGWFNNLPKTNKGELLTSVILINDTGIWVDNAPLAIADLNHHWWLIYVADDENCALHCQVNAYLVNQTRLALAKEMDRVENMIVNKDTSFTSSAKKYVAEHFSNPKFNVLKGQTRIEPDHIYLMDPIGNIMLKYPPINNPEEAGVKGKDILYDIKKLLKFSRLG